MGLRDFFSRRVDAPQTLKRYEELLHACEKTLSSLNKKGKTFTEKVREELFVAYYEEEFLELQKELQVLHSELESHRAKLERSEYITEGVQDKVSRLNSRVSVLLTKTELFIESLGSDVSLKTCEEFVKTLEIGLKTFSKTKSALLYVLEDRAYFSDVME
jgi:predicted  nucleic acid-binding Zn-ribbon protein